MLLRGRGGVFQSRRSSDIHPAGSLMFFILMGGQHAFGTTYREQQHNIIKGKAVNLRALRSKCADACDLFRRMTCVEPRTTQRCGTHRPSCAESASGQSHGRGGRPRCSGGWTGTRQPSSACSGRGGGWPSLRSRCRRGRATTGTRPQSYCARTGTFPSTGSPRGWRLLRMTRPWRCSPNAALGRRGVGTRRRTQRREGQGRSCDTSSPRSDSATSSLLCFTCERIKNNAWANGAPLGEGHR